MKLLVVTIEKFQEIEMYGVLGTLKRSGKFEQMIFWNPDGQKEVVGSNQIGSIKTINEEINVDDFDAIFIPGGASCINLRTNQKAIKLIKEFIDKDKWIISICDGPNALHDNNIFLEKQYSSYPIENIDKKSGKNRNKNYITVDKKYITGKCPSASIDLGIKVIETIFSKELSQKVYKAIFGIE